ncbi:class I adenylate-forming enzyme family protein [Streptomyces sp. HPF1205]|uniref:class I adenylate-forming enzyme family protein n=1 Tax=Streptomyces sp. HPF1205 TaxID=2873262 RepID=UPI001CEC1B22|nr:class I adenylate-forming enzyme family protein [Streptomyces sp. HPF1205]
MTNPAPATAARAVAAGGTDPYAAGDPPPPYEGPRPLHDAFEAAARRHPQAHALTGYDGEPVSYQALLAGVDAAARRLAPLGRPDVLGLAVDDPATFLACYLAAARLGLVAVLLDSRLSDEQLARNAERFDVSWLAVGRDRPGAEGAAHEDEDGHEDGDGRGDGHGDGREAAEGVAEGVAGEGQDEDRPSAGFVLRPLPGRDARRARAAEGYRPGDFVVHCTSGSTGEPKGIVMSQSAIAARVRLWGGDLRLTSSDVVLCALPLDHCHGIDVLTLPALTAGATVVFARGDRLTGRGMARRILRHGVTVVSGLPVMYQMLTDAQAVPDGSLASLRTVISGSAPLPVATQRRFTERFGIPLRQVYGLSEIGVICFDRDYLGGGSIGLPVSGVQWRLEEFADDTDGYGHGGVPGDGGGDGSGDDGEDGERLHELYVRGPALARGYYRDPAATAVMFQDGWLRTHDVLRADPDGWYVRGRLSGFVNVSGSKVSPLEVEAALRECPGVRDSAVAGVPGEDGSERVAALLVPGPGFDLAAVRRTLGARLLPPQLPQRYRTAGALPRTALGKTDYAAVRAILRDAAEEGARDAR